MLKRFLGFFRVKKVGGFNCINTLEIKIREEVELI